MCPPPWCPENDFNIFWFRNHGGGEYLWDILCSWTDKDSRLQSPVRHCCSSGGEDWGDKERSKEWRGAREQQRRTLQHINHQLSGRSVVFTVQARVSWPLLMIYSKQLYRGHSLWLIVTWILRHPHWDWCNQTKRENIETAAAKYFVCCLHQPSLL